MAANNRVLSLIWGNFDISDHPHTDNFIVDTTCRSQRQYNGIHPFRFRCIDGEKICGDKNYDGNGERVCMRNMRK